MRGVRALPKVAPLGGAGFHFGSRFHCESIYTFTPLLSMGMGLILSNFYAYNIDHGETEDAEGEAAHRDYQREGDGRAEAHPYRGGRSG